ncbi:MAG: GNAT family N-acetyltransferase [Rhodospirillaceae bacterium]|nr:GNAT family N-acetyltransferase [Rhodospirillaceae bacterium]
MFLFEPRYRPLPPPLVGARLMLRPPLLADFDSWAELRRASRAFLQPWEPLWGAEALSRRTYRARVSRMAHEWNSDQGYAFHLIASGAGGVAAPRGAVLGGINLNNVRRLSAQSASLGYWMGEAHAGQGLMREALALLLPHAFAGFENDPAEVFHGGESRQGGLGLHRIDAACIPENRRSRALLARMGFLEIGLAPAYLKIGGQWRDHVCHQLLAEDFVAGADIPGRPVFEVG